VSNSTNIALRGQELQRLIASLKQNFNGFDSANKNNSLLEILNSLVQEYDAIPGKLEAAIAREEEDRRAQEEALKNAMNFLDGFSQAIQPVIQSYINEGTQKFNNILEKNKEKLIFTEEELAAAGGSRERAIENTTKAVNIELTEGYSKTSGLGLRICSSEPKTRDEALQLMFKDVETFGELTEEQKLLLSQMSDAEKELLILNALGVAKECVGEGMDQFEENLKIYKDTPSCALRANFSEVIKFDFTRSVKEYLDSAKQLEKPEQEKLQEIYSAAGITEGVSLDKLNLSKEALAGLAEITEVLRHSGNALDTKNTEYNHLNSLIADFERLAQESREQKTDLAVSK
jgi:hypothetical protein